MEVYGYILPERLLLATDTLYWRGVQFTYVVTITRINVVEIVQFALLGAMEVALKN